MPVGLFSIFLGVQDVSFRCQVFFIGDRNDKFGKKISKIYFIPFLKLKLEEFTMIRKIAQTALIILAIATAGIAPLSSLAQSTSSVQFEQGNDNATLNGTITGQEYVDYVLSAKKGQTMSVALTIDDTNGDGSAFFNILPPGSNGEAIFNGSTSPDRYGEVNLPEDGEYTIRVYLMGNDQDAGKTVGYTVSVTIR